MPRKCDNMLLSFVCGQWGWFMDFHGFQSLISRISVVLTWQVCRTCTLFLLSVAFTLDPLPLVPLGPALCLLILLLSLAHPLRSLPLVSAAPDEPSLVSLDLVRVLHNWNLRQAATRKNSRLLLHNRCEMIYTLSVNWAMCYHYPTLTEYTNSIWAGS